MGILRIHYLLSLAVFLSSCDLTENGEEESLFSTPIVYSNSTINWGTLDKHVQINRDIIFDSTTTLIIEPGTIVMHAEGTMLVQNPAGDMERPPFITIRGDIIAIGEEGNPIEFLSVGDGNPKLSIERNILTTNRTEFEWVSGIGFLPIMNSSPSIENCEIDYITFENCDSIRVHNNIVSELRLWFSSGSITKNLISSRIFTLTGRLEIKDNIISSEEVKYLGIYNSHDDRSIFTGNWINNRERAIYIFSGSPTFNRNNVTNCNISIEVQPFLNDPESDTLDFRYNWWGTAELGTVESKIIYESNGDTESLKVVLVDPIATEFIE